MVHVSVSRSEFVEGGYASCMKEYVERGNFIRDRLGLRNQIQRFLLSTGLEHVEECEIVLR